MDRPRSRTSDRHRHRLVRAKSVPFFEEEQRNVRAAYGCIALDNHSAGRLARWPPVLCVCILCTRPLRDAYNFPASLTRAHTLPGNMVILQENYIRIHSLCGWVICLVFVYVRRLHLAEACFRHRMRHIVICVPLCRPHRALSTHIFELKCFPEKKNKHFFFYY